jgi:hypothetical protein
MNIPSDITAEPSMMCHSCGLSHPVSRFRRIRSGSEKRHRICRGCHNRQETLRRAGARQSARMQAVRSAGTQMSSSQTVDDAARILNGLVRQFRGTGRLLRWWRRTAMSLRDTRPQELLRFVEGLSQFENLLHHEQVSAMNYFSTPEGRSFLREEIIRIVQRHPELIVAAGEELNIRKNRRTPNV